MIVETNFTKTAEKALDGETGLIEFHYDDVYPCIGDKLTVRTSPNNKILTFVCIDRHFDFSRKEESVLIFLFDVSS